MIIMILYTHQKEEDVPATFGPIAFLQVLVLPSSTRAWRARDPDDQDLHAESVLILTDATGTGGASEMKTAAFSEVGCHEFFFGYSHF